MSDVNEMSDVKHGNAGEPHVEDNGYWFTVFMVILIVLLATAFAALVHSLSATFGG